MIGCGAQGSAHLAAYARLADVEIGAICDTNEERLRAAREMYGPAAGRFAHYGEMLERSACDLISVCTMPVTRWDRRQR